MRPITTPTECLFCGATPSELTQEDVFPKWLQREVGIARERLTLINGSSVRYQQLLVPACQPCNNVHASQLEQRVEQGVATEQDMYVWLLKLQLGTMYWETGKPISQDGRDPLHGLPIMDRSVFDITYLHGLFQALRHPDGHFVPDPLGSVFRLPAPDHSFDYADYIYVNPQRPDSLEYSAAYLQLRGEAWIVLFDDAGNIARLYHDEIARRVERDQLHPKQVFADVMYARSRYHYLPRTLIAGEPGAAQAVAFTLPMSPVEVLSANSDDLQQFYRFVSRERRD